MARTEVRGGQILDATVKLDTPNQDVVGVLPLVNGGTNANTAANARTQLGLGIGTDVQAFGVPIAKRVTTATTTTTLTPDVGTTDVSCLTAQNGALTVANFTGTPVNETTRWELRIKAATAAGALTFGSNYTASGIAALPTVTILNKTIRCGFIYDSTAAKLVLMAVDAVGYS